MVSTNNMKGRFMRVYMRIMCLRREIAERQRKNGRELGQEERQDRVERRSPVNRPHKANRRVLQVSRDTITCRGLCFGQVVLTQNRVTQTPQSSTRLTTNKNVDVQSAPNFIERFAFMKYSSSKSVRITSPQMVVPTTSPRTFWKKVILSLLPFGKSHLTRASFDRKDVPSTKLRAKRMTRQWLKYLNPVTTSTMRWAWMTAKVFIERKWNTPRRIEGWSGIGEGFGVGGLWRGDDGEVMSSKAWYLVELALFPEESGSAKPVDLIPGAVVNQSPVQTTISLLLPLAPSSSCPPPHPPHNPTHFSSTQAITQTSPCSIINRPSKLMTHSPDWSRGRYSWVMMASVADCQRRVMQLMAIRIVRKLREALRPERSYEVGMVGRKLLMNGWVDEWMGGQIGE